MSCLRTEPGDVIWSPVIPHPDGHSSHSQDRPPYCSYHLFQTEIVVILSVSKPEKSEQNTKVSIQNKALLLELSLLILSLDSFSLCCLTRTRATGSRWVPVEVKGRNRLDKSPLEPNLTLTLTLTLKT